MRRTGGHRSRPYSGRFATETKWYVQMPNARRVQDLIDRGAVIPYPESVVVDDTVLLERVAPGVILHAGTRLAGKATSAGPGCEIGGECPVTVENCQLGHGVCLKGGYYSGATFLDGSSMGSSAHVRPGTLLEEEANGAHAVGLKQTIFLPFVTAGSLINFCDVLMAGGTSRKNHSEIGSSYIHFNFTPHQDKATPSLIGDVPRGVLVDQPPVFLGGQGGLTGPLRIAYGTVIPAGTICRRDVLADSQLYSAPEASAREPQRYTQGLYRAVNRIVTNNLIYIGNIFALREWYLHVRIRTMTGDPFREACWAGALEQIGLVLDERLRCMRELAGKMPASLELARKESGGSLPETPFAQQRALLERWPEMEVRLLEGPSEATGAEHRRAFLEHWERTGHGTSHLEAVKGLEREARCAARAWLQAIVDFVAGLWSNP